MFSYLFRNDFSVSNKHDPNVIKLQIQFRSGVCFRSARDICHFRASNSYLLRTSGTKQHEI